MSNLKNINFIVSLLVSFFVCESINGQTRAILTGKVSDQFGILPGAKVSIEGTDFSTTTNVNGIYTFDLEEGEYNISVSFVMYSTLTKTIILKTGETTTLDFILETSFSIDEPISLASRAAPTSLLSTTDPVDIITRQQLESSSNLELGQVLHYLIPSFHSTNQTIADGTDHIDPATLRGLGPDQVLVLVNGKRRHYSSLLNLNGTVGKGTVGTDFNSIPISSVDRIEVLRDGATSQYGSDAIAGVINIILKEQTEVIDIDSRAKINSEGDGVSSYFAANFGLKIGKDGFINVTGEFRERGATNRAGQYTGSVFFDDAATDDALINQNNFYQSTGYKDKRVMEIGSAQTQNLALSFNGKFPISDKGEFYFHGGRNYREGKSKGFYRFPKDKDRVIQELFPNGFSPEILTDIQDNAITAGVRGSKDNWKLDFSHSIGSNTLDYTINNSNNASLGVSSPKTFYSGGFEYKQNTTNFDVSKSFNWLQGINVAFGGEIRVENYVINAGEEASYIDGESTYIDANGIVKPRVPGVQVFPGIQPENELSRFRTNSSGYLDIETSITKKLLLKTAARYESYNDFGSQPIWKISSRYMLNNKLSLRAGYSTGFRAPSLHQVFFQSISTQFVNNDIVRIGTFNNESAIVSSAFKIGKLKPELSKHINIGFSAKYNDNITFSFDYYNIKIEDRIVLSGRFATGYEALLKPFNVGAAQFFTNAIDSKTTGIDTSLNYHTAIGSGQFSLLIGANFTKTKVVGPIKVNETLKNQENVLFNREEIARVESAQPNFKFSSTLSYEFNKLKVQLGNTYFGKVKYVDPNDGNPSNWVLNKLTNKVETRDQTFKPKLLTDIAVSYQILAFLKFTLGGNNIFNVYPDKHTHSENINNGNFMYSRRVQQFGVNGANIYTRLLIRL
jgi:iron complex outermembrane recepter protein